MNKFFYILVIIIFTLFIIYLLNCDNIEYFESNTITINEEKYMKIDKKDDLINRYRKYNEDLKYNMNIHFDYYVKDTNKAYARFITQLDRNRLYYEEKLKILKYPFIIRKEISGYYIDYQLPNRMINNKIEDVLWNDFNSDTQILITLYDASEDFIKQISDLLKSYNNIEYQYSNSKADMLYDNFIYTRRVLTDIGQTLIPIGKHIISNLHLEKKFQELKTNFENKENIKNIENKVENISNVKIGKDFTDYLKNQIKPQIELKIKQELNDEFKKNITLGIEEKIRGFTPYFKQESLKFLNKINIDDMGGSIQMITNNSYIELSLETRDYRYIYIYDINDPYASTELINLVNFLNDVENLDYINDYYTKNLRYYRVPINIMRILIKFGEYLKLF